MPSTCKNTMQVKKVEGTPLPAKGAPETTVQQEVQEKPKTLQRKAKAPSKKAASKPAQKTSVKKASKKPAVRKKASTPADAILQSKAVDPDIEKASKPTKKTKKSPAKKTSTKKTKK